MNFAVYFAMIRNKKIFLKYSEKSIVKSKYLQ
jgi:hypothetical protein